MGKYRPPALLDPSLDTRPVARQSHALGARARKLPQGILTVRFEMPFAIWCSTCPADSNNRLIGQGVRFNAEKKKVGNYFSTPVWSFRMKHTACGGWIEIRTDPKSSEYIVTEGATRRDTGSDVAVAAREGATLLLEERDKKRQDAFEALEGKAAEKTTIKNEGKRIEAIRSLKERDWRDTDASNRKLRATFRTGRKEREKEAIGVGRLQERMSLGIEIVPEIEHDRIRAGLVDFGRVGGRETNAVSKPMFGASLAPGANGRTPARRARSLQQELVENTRIRNSPFTTDRDDTHRASGLQLIPKMSCQRYAPIQLNLQQNINGQESEFDGTQTSRFGSNDACPPRPLVAYDSD